MFCPKCGTENADGTVFCKECGASLAGSAPAQPQAQTQDANGNVAVGGVKLPVNRNQLIGIIVFLAAVILLIVIIVNVAAGGGAKGTAVKFMNASYKGDGKAMAALLPDEFVDEICDRRDMDRDDYIENINDALELTIDALDDKYDKWSVSVKATKSKDLSDKKVEELEARYENYYGVDMSIKEAQEVTLELTTTADGDKDTAKVKLTVIKVDGKWYVDYFSYSSISLG